MRGAAARRPFFLNPMEFKFCIETFIRWEQLTGQSFQQINFNDPNDRLQLLYCAYIIQAPDCPSFEIFAKALQQKPRIMAKAIKQVANYNALLAQFSEHLPKVAKEPTEKEDSAAPIKLGDVVARLIVSCGLDVRYAYREMTIPDMMLFVRALDEKRHQELEAQRLFTYLTLLPHVDQKKLPTPQKLYAFPWEVEEAIAESKRAMEANKETFEKFMRGELVALDKITWNKDGKQ